MAIKPNTKVLAELQAEKAALDSKLDKLTSFLYTDGFHSLQKKHQALLIRQAEYMGGYSHVLEVRIADLED